jgi:protein-tyrosine-phosphatase
MAEALLRAKLPVRWAVEVVSAGTAGDGTPAAELAGAVMGDAGLDIVGRPSRPLTVEDLAGADLAIGMARDHAVAMAVLCPDALERIFTFKDLLDRAGRAGGLTGRETVRSWARRMSAGRSRTSLLSMPSSADIDDPMGGSRADFERTFGLLDRLTTALAACLDPAGGTAPVVPPAATRRAWWRRAPEG